MKRWYRHGLGCDRRSISCEIEMLSLEHGILLIFFFSSFHYKDQKAPLGIRYSFSFARLACACMCDARFLFSYRTNMNRKWMKKKNKRLLLIILTICYNFPLWKMLATSFFQPLCRDFMRATKILISQFIHRNKLLAMLHDSYQLVFFCVVRASTSSRLNINMHSLL